MYDQENDFGITLSFTPEKNCVPIILNGESVFYIYKKEDFLTIQDKNGWRLFMNALPFIFFGISIHTYLKVTVKRRKPLPIFLSLLAIAIGIRTLNYLWGFPNNFSDYSLFSPQIYASDFINCSLGDVFINMCLVFWVFVFFAINVQGQFNDYKRTKFGPIFGSVLLIFYILIGYYISNLIYEIINDSVIIFDFTNFSQLNLFSFIGLLVFMVAFANFILLTIIVNNYLEFCFPKKYFKYLVLIGVFILFEFLPIKKYNICYYYVFMASAALFFMLDSKFFKIKFDFNSYSLLLWIMLISLCESFFLVKMINQKERLLRLDYATQLLNREDKDLEIKLESVLNGMLQDSLIQSLNKESTEENFAKINKFIYEKYLLKSVKQYQFDFYYLNEEFQSILPSDSIQNKTIQASIKQEFRNEDQFLFGIKSIKEKGYYIKLPLIDQANKKMYAVVKVFNTLDISKHEYKNFLNIDNAMNRVRDYNYSVGVYENNILKINTGNYLFTNSVQLQDLKKINEGEFTYNNGYEILWYRQPLTNTIIAIARETSLAYLLTTIFAYIFFIYFAVISLYIFGNILARSNLNYGRFMNLLSLNLRLRIHIAILIVVFFSFLTIGYFTSYYLISRISIKSTEELQSYSKLMQTRMSQFFNSANISGKGMNDKGVYDSRISQILKEMSLRFNSGVNLYDNENGKLIYTSEQELLRLGLNSDRISYSIFQNLKSANIQHFLIDEHIGNYQYISTYSYLKNSADEILAILKISYISSNLEIRAETNSILITLVNTYVIVFLISSFFALIISNSVTKKFRSIVKQFTQINLSKTNQPLKWNSSDEIGLLIKEYNRMLKKLENSSVLLAKSEREMAWREMAKQVAHEIKNPLTPMKLSIQMLERAMKNKNPNIGEITEKVAHTVLEHIEVLTQIATDFSSFAKMPELNRTIVSLNEILFAVTGMYNDDSHCEYLFLIPDHTIMVFADKNQLIRVFTNIIQNAIQSITEDRKGNISMVVTKIKDNFVRITILDNGEGISPEKGKKLFEPYFTTKSSGTGLGLAMCKDIIEKFGGNISYESIIHQGSNFHIDLPTYEENEDDELTNGTQAG